MMLHGSTLSALNDIDLVVDEVINRKKNIKINKDLTLKNRDALFKNQIETSNVVKIYSEYKDNIVDLF